MGFLKRLFGRKVDVDQVFLEGMDAFADKDFNLAYSNFMKAYKATKSARMKANCLTNASTALERMGREKEAASHLLLAATFKAGLEAPHREVVELLDKSFTFAQKNLGLSEMGSVVAPLMLYRIATNDFVGARRLYKLVNDVDDTDPLLKFAKEVFGLIRDRPPRIWEDTDLFQFPQAFPMEMYPIREKAQQVIRAYAAVTVKLESPAKLVRVGESVEVQVRVKNFTPITVKKLILNAGAKGTLLTNPLDEELNLSKAEAREFIFTLEAQLTGQWVVGPVDLAYEVAGQTYEVSSETVRLDVQEGQSVLELQLDFEVVEEDFEFEFISTLTNKGRRVLENIQVGLAIPSVAKVSEGTPQKTIFELRPEESFQFTNKVRFESGILGKRYRVKLVAKHSDGEADKELYMAG